MPTTAARAADHFEVMLLGQPVDCESLGDAATIKTVADIFSGADHTPYLPQHVERLVSVLVRYKRRPAADNLLARFKRPGLPAKAELN
jgi:hypothetical protein